MYMSMDKDESGSVYCMAKNNFKTWPGTVDFCINKTNSFTYLQRDSCRNPNYLKKSFWKAKYVSNGDFWHCIVSQ